MKILIFGAGAIGMAFGGFLSRAHEVTLLGRPRHIEAIRRSGLRVKGIWGEHCFRNFELRTDYRQVVREKRVYDLILLCVKSYDTARSARILAGMPLPITAVISLQNGLGNVEALEKILPPSRILAGRVIFGVEIEAPGAIKVTVIAAPTALGEIQRRRKTPRVKRLSVLFSESGLPTVACADVRSLLWGKVIYNCALNPLATLLGCHYGYLGETDWTRALMDEVMREIYRVAGKSGIALKPKNFSGYRRLFYGKLLPSTYHHHPSMLQDILNGKRTEIRALNGAVAEIARRTRVKIPVNDFLVREIKAKERRAVKP